MKFLKNKYKLFISSIYLNFIIFGSLYLLYALFSSSFKQKLKSAKNIKTKRELASGYEKQKTEDICAKADKKLINLYTSSDYYYYFNDNPTIKKSTSYLRNYLEKRNTNELKNYIFSFYAQIILVIIDLIMIIIWIILCYYVSKDNHYQYLLKRCSNNCFKDVFFILSISMYLILIIFNIIILVNFQYFFQDINNSICSVLKITYHTYNGDEYELKPKWTGINQIKNLIQKTQESINKLVDKNNQIRNTINEIKQNEYFNNIANNFMENHYNEFCDLNLYNVPNPNPLSKSIITDFIYCSDIFYSVQQEYNKTFSEALLDINDTYNILNSIFINKEDIKISFTYAKSKLDTFDPIIKDIELEYFNNLVFFYETIIRQYFYWGMYSFFVITILLETVGLIDMLIFGLCFTLFSNKLYNFIWNMQYLSFMIILLMIVCFSSMNIFIDDISLILKSSFKSDEIEKNRTFSNNNYDVKGIHTCLNNDGNLTLYMNLDSKTELLSHFYSKINIINDNLNYFKNYEIFAEKNETKNILEELENKPFIAKFKLSDLEYITNSEDILEDNLNIYTNNNKNQDLGDNEYYSKYFFVHDKEFCKKNYKLIKDNDTLGFYNEGKNCMILKNFPGQDNYFKGIKIKNIEENFDKDYNLNDLVNSFKERYYDINGFEPSFLKLLRNSKEYLNNKVIKESNKIKNAIISIYEIFQNKVNILKNLYQKLLPPNGTDLFSVFNCKYLKRDFNILVDKLESNLNYSIYKLTVYILIFGITTFLSIFLSIYSIKLKKVDFRLNDSIFKPNEKDEKTDISEKPKIGTIKEKINLEEGMKSSLNEKAGLKKKIKHKNKDNNIVNEKNH